MEARIIKPTLLIKGDVMAIIATPIDPEVDMQMGYADYIRLGRLKGMDTIKTMHPGFLSHFAFSEFTTFCKEQGQPDYGNIEIRIKHDKCVVEMKTLRDYLIGYRNFSIFQEEAAFNIFIDCIRACDPLELEVIGTFTPRGAMTTIAHFVYNRLSEEGLTQQTKQNALNEN